MGRGENVSKAILDAIYKEEKGQKSGVLARILYFFSIIRITLARYDAATFQKLRNVVWKFEENKYRASFDSKTLNSAGDLGYSGSV
jgi:hypothetical protein